MGGGLGEVLSVLKDVWVLDVDRGVWSEVSELICLVYNELYEECICAVAYIHMTVCLESLA